MTLRYSTFQSLSEINLKDTVASLANRTRSFSRAAIGCIFSDFCLISTRRFTGLNGFIVICCLNVNRPVG